MLFVGDITEETSCGNMFEFKGNISKCEPGIHPEVTGFSFYLILPTSLWPWVDSATKKNEYQEFYWG
jgi:hypothetical protein